MTGQKNKGNGNSGMLSVNTVTVAALSAGAIVQAMPLDNRLLERQQMIVGLFPLQLPASKNAIETSIPAQGETYRESVLLELRDIDEAGLRGAKSTWRILGLVFAHPEITVDQVLNSPEIGDDGLACVARLRLFGYLRNERAKLVLTKRAKDALRHRQLIS